MRDTTFTELRNQAKHYFDLVEGGETARVLRNGGPIAEIHSIPPNSRPGSDERRTRCPSAAGSSAG